MIPCSHKEQKDFLCRLLKGCNPECWWLEAGKLRVIATATNIEATVNIELEIRPYAEDPAPPQSAKVPG